MKRPDQKKDRKITILQPNFSEGNEYIPMIRSILEDMGYETIRLKEIWGCGYQKGQIRTANLNWYENISDRGMKGYLKFFAKAVFLVYLKQCRKCRIAVTVHNKCSHDRENQKISLFLLRWECIWADRIIILCAETRRYLRQLFSGRLSQRIVRKCFLIPHPNYIGAYREGGPLPADCGWRIPADQHLNLLFFGFLKPYKNIELLIDLADLLKDRAVRIVIAGDGEKSYVETLKKQVQARDNILFFPGYIPDGQVWSAISACDCVILPYNIGTVLNSGACILSFSVGKNVIAPMIGTMREFPRELAYGYHYKKEENHLAAVYRKVCQVYDEYQNRRSVFNEKQRRLKEIVAEKNSREAVGKRYRILYEMMERGI